MQLLLSFTISSILPNRLTVQNYKDFMENNMPDFLVDMPLITTWNCTSFMMAFPHIWVSFSAVKVKLSP
jgi:hypothetical protein